MIYLRVTKYEVFGGEISNALDMVKNVQNIELSLQGTKVKIRTIGMELTRGEAKSEIECFSYDIANKLTFVTNPNERELLIKSEFNKILDFIKNSLLENNNIVITLNITDYSAPKLIIETASGSLMLNPIKVNE